METRMLCQAPDDGPVVAAPNCTSGSSDAGQRIVRNAMLAEVILENLDIRSMCRARTSSREWDDVCQRIAKRRKDVQSLCYAYDFSANPSKENMKIKPAVQLLHDHGLLGYKNVMLVEFLINHFKRNQRSLARNGFLFHGGITSVPDLYSYFRKLLPPDCQIVAVTSSNGIIPSIFDANTKTFSSTEIQSRGQLVAGVSYLLWPDFGFDVTFFDQNSTLSEFEPQPDGSHKDLKCILIFTTEYMTREGRREVYVNFEHVNSIFVKYKKGFALGGVVVDKIFRFPTSATSEDTSRPEAAFRRVKGTKFVGVAFSGQNVQAASGVFDSESLDAFELELLEFKQSLDFDPDDFSPKARTFGFLFTCSGRGPAMFKESNAEIGVINKTFPVVLFTGVFGDGEFGENYWPKLHSQGTSGRLTEDEETRFWHFYTNVLVLIHVKS